MGLSEKDRAIRLGRIGASNAPGILGVNPYSSPLREYARILGLEEFEGNDSTRRGDAYEAPIAWEYRRKHAMTEWLDAELETSQTIVHPKLEWLCATPDRLVQSGPKTVCLLEVKCVGANPSNDWGPPGSDEVPNYVAAQVAVQLAVAHALWGVDRCDVAADLGGTPWPYVYTLWRDPGLEARVLQRLAAFHVEHLVPRRPPAPTGSDSDKDAIAAIFRDPRKVERDANPAETALLREALVYKKERDESERLYQEATNLLRAAIGNDYCLRNGKVKAVYTLPGITKRLDVERLKKEHPDVYAKCCEEKPLARTLRLYGGESDGE
jgi:putative phage-type endonuclease